MLDSNKEGFFLFLTGLLVDLGAGARPSGAVRKNVRSFIVIGDLVCFEKSSIGCLFFWRFRY
jgi:hypothetical protein